MTAAGAAPAAGLLLLVPRHGQRGPRVRRLRVGAGVQGAGGALMSDCAGVRGWPRLAAPRSAPATPACVTSPWPPASMRPTGAPRPCLDCLDEAPVIVIKYIYNVRMINY